LKQTPVLRLTFHEHSPPPISGGPVEACETSTRLVGRSPRRRRAAADPLKLRVANGFRAQAAPRRRRSAADPLKLSARCAAASCRGLSRRRRSAADPLKHMGKRHRDRGGDSPPPISGGPVEARYAVVRIVSTSRSTRRRRSAADPLKPRPRARHGRRPRPRRRRSAADPLKHCAALGVPNGWVSRRRRSAADPLKHRRRRPSAARRNLAAADQRRTR